MDTPIIASQELPQAPDNLWLQLNLNYQFCCFKQDKTGLRWHIYGLVIAALLPLGPDEDPHPKGLNTHAVFFEPCPKQAHFGWD